MLNKNKQTKRKGTMSYTESTLAKGEKIISNNKVTKWGYAVIGINTIIMIAVGSAIWGWFFDSMQLGIVAMSMVIIPLALIALATQWFTRYTNEFAVTNKKVVAKSGLISRKTDELLLKKIEGVDVEQSVLGRILNFGHIKITGPGQQVVLFEGIDNPLVVKNQIQSKIA
jgi:uncharacterized membrane protein YdbT with pleckstrin-like domain